MCLFTKVKIHAAAILMAMSVLFIIPLHVFAASTFTPINGVSITADNSKNWAGVGTESSMSNGTVTCKAIGGVSGSKTNTVILTNTSGGKAVISFDYTISSADSYTGFSSTSGTYEVTLVANDTVTFTIASGYLNTATLTMSNFSIVTILSEGTVTVSSNLALGYGYIQVDGADIADYAYQGTDVTITDAGATFTAVANNAGITYNGTTVAAKNDNAHFVAWVNPDTMEILSLDASYAIYPTTESIKIQAIFSKSYSVSAYFQVGNTLYQGLGNALTAFENGVGTVITLRSTGSILKNESYTIPEGCTLLIPYDAAGTVFTTEPVCTTSTTKASAYKILYMRASASLTINGTLSLAGRHYCAKGSKSTGCVNVGKFGAIRMLDGSCITVNGNLYCYGYIGGYSATSEGQVIVNNGATVYEYFQLEDFRGGAQTYAMKNEVFPFSQYYVQNVQVPMTLHYGATEYAYVTLYVSGASVSKAVAFIGTSSSFVTLQEGASVTKSYDINTDRMTVTLNGSATLSNFELNVNALYSLDTADYIMPIPSNMTVKVESGSAYVSQDLAMIPGSSLEIGEGASLTLGEGTRLYVYDQDDWGTYCWDKAADTNNSKFQILRYAYNRKYTRTEADLIDAAILVNGSLDASAGALYTTEHSANIHSTGSGQVILSDGSESVTYQLIQGYTETTSDDAEEDTESVEHPNEYVPIPITPAKLLNIDGSYVETADGGNNTYTYVDGFWRCTTHSYGTEGAYTEGRGDSTVPSYAEDDCLTYTCSVCNHTKQEDLKMSFAIYATNVRAGDGLDIFFYINKTAVGDGTGLVAKIVRTRCGVADAPLDVPFDNWTEYGTDYLRFSYTGIAAKEMTDEVYVKIYRDGVQVCSVQVESVQSYALRALGTEKNELSTALVDMLNYGAAAQNTFTYNTGDLANAGLNETQQGFATQSTTYSYSTLVKSEDLAAASVSATNKLMLTFYYYTDLTANGYTAHITYTDHYGTEQTRTINSFTERTLEGITVYGVDVTGLAIADGRQLITCVIKDSNGEEVSTSVCSVENYVAKTIEQAGEDPDPVYELLMKFVDSAYAYFH